MKLCEIKRVVSDILSDIEKIAKSEITGDHEARFDKEGSWLTIKFWNKKKDYSEQSMNVGVKDGVLQLSDVYIPDSLRGKGFLTKFLAKIKDVEGLNGQCKVHVAMNQAGWKTIISRAGLEWIA